MSSHGVVEKCYIAMAARDGTEPVSDEIAEPELSRQVQKLYCTWIIDGIPPWQASGTSWWSEGPWAFWVKHR